MPDEEQKQESQNGGPVKAQDIPAEHAVFVIPLSLLQSMTNYLTTKAYCEVAQFLQALGQIHAQDGRKLKQEE